MQITYLATLILIITSVFISVNTTVASSGIITNTDSTTIQSPFTTSPPLIDGILSINEWNNAEVRTFTLSYPNESYPITLYVMNDGTNLYFGATVTDNDYHMGDHIAISFNNSYDFLYIAANNWSYDGHRNSSVYTTLDTEQGGTNDIIAKASNSVSNNSVNYIFEISHPFNSSDDSNDISMSPGDSVNFSIFYLDMNRGYNATNSWPSSRLGTLILGSPTSTIFPSVTVVSTPTMTLVPTPSQGGDVVSRYAGSDGIVQRSEAVLAVMDYFNNGITRQEAISVVIAYFTGPSTPTPTPTTSPSPAPTATPSPTPPTGNLIPLTSQAFQQGGNIPAKCTCDGADVSPALSWGYPPSGTRSLALILDDPDAPGGIFTHWVLYNLPANLTSLPEGVQKIERPASGGIQGMNDFPGTGYNGPCPPAGGAHTYRFILYALDTELNLGAGAIRLDVLNAMQGHVLAQVELDGEYGI